MIESDEKFIIGGIGVTCLAALVASLLQKEEGQPPEEIAAQINSVSWETADYDFTDDWGDPKTAKFYKAEISITSDQAFTGRIILSCPNIISPVPLLTEDAYQQLLQEINDLVATTTGATQQLWINRKEIALQFPSVDGFRIDYRWWANWDQRFRAWIGASIDPLIWQGINISQGTKTVYVGFFKNQNAAVGINPVQISLYLDETLLNVISSNLVPPEDVPQILSIDMPSSVPSGGEVKPIVTIRLPELLHNSQYYGFSLRVSGNDYRIGNIDIASAGYMSRSLVATRESLGCAPTYIGLDAPDDIYTVEGIWDRGTWLSTIVNLSPGVYPVTARVQSWRVGVEPDGCGTYWYGTGPVATYNFGVVGELVVT